MGKLSDADLEFLRMLDRWGSLCLDFVSREGQQASRLACRGYCGLFELHKRTVRVALSEAGKAVLELLAERKPTPMVNEQNDHNALRALADTIDSFAGVVAQEWTYGEKWWLRFAAGGEGCAGMQSQLAVLRVLLALGVPTEVREPRDSNLVEYLIQKCDAPQLAARLSQARKELWRLRH